MVQFLLAVFTCPWKYFSYVDKLCLARQMQYTAEQNPAYEKNHFIKPGGNSCVLFSATCVSSFLKFCGLQVQPVIHFKYYRPVFVVKKRRCKIIVGIHQEYITHRFIPPLKSAVDVEVIRLCIVLHKGCPEKICYSWLGLATAPGRSGKYRLMTGSLLAMLSR